MNNNMKPKVEKSMIIIVPTRVHYEPALFSLLKSIFFSLKLFERSATKSDVLVFSKLRNVNIISLRRYSRDFILTDGK